MLSVLINTKNEEKNIVRCLESVKKIADEVVVVDMNSSDKTVELARKNGATVINYKKEHGFADPARNFALGKVKGDWVMILDADEEVSVELAGEIPDLIKKADQESIDVYYLPRKNIIFDKWIEHTGWWSDYQPRLFRKGHLQWPARVHAQPVVSGNTLHLPTEEKFAITHYNYESVEHFIGKLNRYTSLSAESGKDKMKGKKLSSGQVMEVFGSEFLRRFFAGEGVKDGVHGISLSLLQSMYEVTTVLKAWELGGYQENKIDPESGVRALRAWQKELNYWVADYYLKQSSGLGKVWWMMRRKFKV